MESPVARAEVQVAAPEVGPVEFSRAAQEAVLAAGRVLGRVSEVQAAPAVDLLTSRQAERERELKQPAAEVRCELLMKSSAIP